MTFVTPVTPIVRHVRRVGRRGATLLFIAALCTGTASSLTAAPPPTGSGAVFYTLLSSLLPLLPLLAWAGIWQAVGVLCLVQAFMRSDRYAFSAGAGMLTVWAVLQGAAWVNGANRGWVGLVIYLVAAGWLTVVSTWPEIWQWPSGDVAVITADDLGMIRTWDRGAERLFGWTESEAVGLSLTTIIPLRHRVAHTAGLERVRAGGRSRLAGQVVSLEALHRDGHEFPVSLSVGVRTLSGGLVFVGVVRATGERP